MDKEDQKVINDYHLDIYEGLAGDPKEWFISAKNLFECANYVLIGFDSKKRDYGIIPPYLLLIGLALENYIKGFIIDDNKLSNIQDLINKSFKHHDLVAYYNLSELNFSKDEVIILKLLSEFITWSGRYPVPKDYKKMYKQSEVKLLKKYLTRSKVRKFIKRIESDLKSLDKD